MRGFEADGRDDAGFVGLLPALDADAPTVAGLEAGEAVFGAGGDEVVADLHLVLQKLFGDDGAHGVLA